VERRQVTNDRIIRRVLKPLVFGAALIPAASLVWAIFTGHVSANPLGEITNGTGDWTLRFLCLALAVTPLRRLTGWNGAITFRRMLGLFAFFYGAVHFSIYLVFDRLAGTEFAGTVSWPVIRGLAAAIDDDIYKRPFITVGFTAFALMVPLAATSTAGMIRRLGGRRWQALHRLMYASCIGGVVHYWWLVRADVRRPMVYGAIVTLLLVARAAHRWFGRDGRLSTKSISPFRSGTVRSGRTPSSSGG
jgi:sulfoxide reductase heme-binding subunit YedZ